MQNLDLQQVIVYRNNKFKFAHVAVNNMFTRNGQKNYSASLNGAYQHAKYAMRGAADNPCTEPQFSSSFITRLINTGIESWEETQRTENLTIDQALDLALDIGEMLDGEGYDVTGCFRGKSIRNTGVKGITNYVLKNATQRKIFDVVTQITAGMEGLNLRKAQNAIYMQYIKEKLHTRRQFWFFIHRNMDTLAQ